MSGILYGKNPNSSGNYEIDDEAYIKFIDTMFVEKPPFFDDADDQKSKDLIDFIKRQASGTGKALIRDDNGNEVEISTDNAKVTAVKDKIKDDKGRKRRHITIALPGENPDTDHPQGLGYLDRYVKTLVDTAMGGDNVVANPQAAAKLLLGMMLLTRCM